MSQPSDSTLSDDEFSDALDDFPFFDAPNSFHSQQPPSSSIQNPNLITQNSVSEASYQPHTIPDSQLQSQLLPQSPGLRRRRLHSKKNSKSRLKNSSDWVPDYGFDGSDVSLEKSHKLSWKLEDDYEQNDRLDVTDLTDVSRVCVEKIGDSITSLNYSEVISLGDDGNVNDDRLVSADSADNGSNLVFAFVRLMMKVVSFKMNLLVAFVKFPVWATYSSYMFVTDPFAIMRRVKRYVVRIISRFLKFCLGKVKRIVGKCLKRKRSICKFCFQMGRGLFWFLFVGFVLDGLFLFAFVIGGAIMQRIMEKPVREIEQLNFDYTRDKPMAFVPIVSCPDSFCLECNEKIKFDSVGSWRVIPPGHKIQATVLLTLPESDYNRNLGNFQVKVDFLSSNGKSLASATQPCTMQFRSWPIRLLMTVFKLAPLVTGYSVEAQTLDIKFNGYTEQEIPTSCVRVVLEPRAEFAKGGGIPQIYTAYLKLESQLPLLKRMLWSWKATVFVWTGIVIFTVGMVFMMLCFAPLFVPRLQPRGVPVNNAGSS